MIQDAPRISHNSSHIFSLKITPFGPFTPISPSIQSMADSSAPSPVVDPTLIEKIVEKPSPMTTGGDMIMLSNQRHPQYYFKDGNIVFLVDNTLFNVHQYFFQRDSSHFASLFEGVISDQGATDDNPIILSDTKASDFDEFLSILYPTDFRCPDDKTTAQWTSILHLAVKWGFDSIKLLSIERLTFTATPIDKIVLGRRYDITEWLAGAYESVCTRPNSLTIKEGIKLGVEDTVRISTVRQAYGFSTARYDPALLLGDILDIFAIESSPQLLASPIHNNPCSNSPVPDAPVHSSQQITPVKAVSPHLPCSPPAWLSKPYSPSPPHTPVTSGFWDYPHPKALPWSTKPPWPTVCDPSPPLCESHEEQLQRELREPEEEKSARQHKERMKEEDESKKKLQEIQKQNKARQERIASFV